MGISDKVSSTWTSIYKRWKCWLPIFSVAGVVLIVVVALLISLASKSHDDHSETLDDCTTKGCHGLKQTIFPNIDFAFMGYNILKGYPNQLGHDPGFTQTIFTTDYRAKCHTSDCRYNIPTGLHGVTDNACATSFTSKIIQRTSELQNSLSLSASGFGKGTKFSFFASAGYKQASSEISRSKNVLILSTAKCLLYSSKLIEDSAPQFSKTFRQWIDKLDKAKSNSTFFRFFDTFGTHYPFKIAFGSRYTYAYSMTSEFFQSISSKGVDISAIAGYASENSSFGLDLGFSYGHSNIVSKFLQTVKIKTITIGARPPANNNAQTWASTVKNNPVPIEYKLKPIEHLFTDKYMRHIAVNYNKIFNNIQSKQVEYCKYLKGLGQLSSCVSLSSPAGITLKNTRIYDHYRWKYVITVEECRWACLEESECKAVTYCTACINGSPFQCFMYGKQPQASVISDRLQSYNLTYNLVSYNHITWSWKYNPYVLDTAATDSIIFPTQIKDFFTIFYTRAIGKTRQFKTESVLDCQDHCMKDADCEAFTFKDTEIRCHLYAGNEISRLVQDRHAHTYFISKR